jgi:ribonuclease BN (tRNA processing enzyme)
MKPNRRQFLLGAGSLALSREPSVRAALAQDKPGTRLILLGTKGGPRVGGAGRRNPSTLLIVNNTPYVVDCGYGTSLQLLAAGIPLNTVRYIFVTHHHSDHNLEFGALFYNAWATGLPFRVDAYGPPGLERMTRAFFEYMKLDIDTRIHDEGRPDPRGFVAAHEFDAPGVVIQTDEVKVRAGLVRHPSIKQAYAYRFDTKDRSIVVSGDTTYSPELAEFAKGADVLVHEVMYLPGIEGLLKRVPNASRFRAHLLASHTVPEDVGKVAAQAGVKTVVLTHFVPGDDPSITDDDWSAGVRKYFGGRIVVGRDLMEVT